MGGRTIVVEVGEATPAQAPISFDGLLQARSMNIQNAPVSIVPFPTVSSQEEYLGTGTSPYSHWLHWANHALSIPQIYHSLAFRDS